MENNKKAIDYLEKHIPELAEAAVKQAYCQTAGFREQHFGFGERHYQ
jgi:hypothetical protein